MVHLTKIYTKTGDNGETSLADFSRTNKHSVTIEAIGAVDEANSAIGMIHAHYHLDSIQNDLFDLGAVLAGSNTVQITPQRIEMLELAIDDMNEDLPTLQSFILPKGDIHNARAIVRRAERRVWEAIDIHGEVPELYNIDPITAQYLNRLSDYLFCLARYDAGRMSETLWKPMGKDEK